MASSSSSGASRFFLSFMSAAKELELFLISNYRVTKDIQSTLRQEVREVVDSAPLGAGDEGVEDRNGFVKD